jgi:predicted SprT family Zn-dependent metalloprotease
MDMTQAKRIANELMDEQDLIDLGWTFAFDNATSRLGACHHAKRLISMSRHFVAAADEEAVRQTMIHEIAHALLPVKRWDGTTMGHGREWKNLARKLGYTGERRAVNPGAIPRKAKQRRRPSSRVSAVRPRFAEGDTVWSPGGAAGITGIVVKVNRTRYRVEDANGGLWAVPFELAKEASGTSKATSVTFV